MRGHLIAIPSCFLYKCNYPSTKIYPYSFSFGSTRFAMIAIKNTVATQLSAKTFCTTSGKMEKISGTCVKPIPTLSERAAIVMLRWLKPQLLIILKTTDHDISKHNDRTATENSFRKCVKQCAENWE